MSFLNRLFSRANKNVMTMQVQESKIPIDLQKVYPRIKGLFDEKYPDPVKTSTEIELSQSDSPIIKPLANGIGVCYMLDRGSDFQIIQNRHLSDDLTIEKLHDAAVTNMAIAISDKTEVNGDPNNVMMVTNGGNFEATMLLADFFWDQIQPLFKDELCVAIPANDLLFIAGKNSSQGRQTLRTLVTTYFENKQTRGLIVRHIYERSNGAWKLIETV